MGEMGSLIEISILVFVAGSLVKKIGGHNPTEVASLGKAVIIHEGTDDYTSQPSGAAGKRIVCGGIIEN